MENDDIDAGVPLGEMGGGIYNRILVAVVGRQSRRVAVQFFFLCFYFLCLTTRLVERSNIISFNYMFRMCFFCVPLL